MRVGHLVCAAALSWAPPALAGEGDGSVPGGPVPDAAALVSAMSAAVRDLDYEGTFVHMAGGHLSSMRILHSSVDGGELERMSALDGEAREVMRDRRRVMCIFPASASVTVTSAKPRRALPEFDASLATNPNYAVEHAGSGRVAGREAHVVRIAPIDALRYGYRFWIDAETNMLLRSRLVDERGRTLEEVLFTAIEYVDDIDPARFEVEIVPGRDTWLESDVEPERAALPGDAERIGFAPLPPGYEKLGESYRAMPLGGGPVSHAMLSDGIASVSVYVEHLAREAQDRSAEGPSRIGGVSAYGKSLGRGFVTVVGEVPAATVRAIAEAVRLDG